MTYEFTFCCDDFKQLHWGLKLSTNYIKDGKVQFSIKVGKSFGGELISQDIFYCPFCGTDLHAHLEVMKNETNSN